ncbi:hypothetical protein HC776_01785 [bacterium]|nr:hypothetical protein [bacterium]
MLPRSIYTALRVIDNLNILLAPFLPFSAQTVHNILGYEGQIFGDLHIVEYHEATRSHKALTYDATRQTGRWAKRELPQGQALREPKPLYVKLEESVVEAERGLLGQPRDEKPIVVEA